MTPNSWHLVRPALQVLFGVHDPPTLHDLAMGLAHCLRILEIVRIDPEKTLSGVGTQRTAFQFSDGVEKFYSAVLPVNERGFEVATPRRKLELARMILESMKDV